MDMTKEQVQAIVKRYPTLVLLEDDLYDAIDLVYDLLCAEADAIKEKEPYAVRAIDRLEAAAYEVHELGYEISNMNLYEVHDGT